jgi:hypothetical protein
MQLIAAKAATPPAGEHPRSPRTLGRIGRATRERHRHQERVAGRLQVTNDLDAVKTTVPKQPLGSDACLTSQTEQALQHVGQLLALADIAEGHRQALTALDQVGGGVGVEVAGAALGLAAVQFVGLVPGLTVVGQLLNSCSGNYCLGFVLSVT